VSALGLSLRYRCEIVAKMLQRMTDKCPTISHNESVRTWVIVALSLRYRCEIVAKFM
jgi:hypothetical protein